MASIKDNRVALTDDGEFDLDSDGCYKSPLGKGDDSEGGSE